MLIPEHIHFFSYHTGASIEFPVGSAGRDQSGIDSCPLTSLGTADLVTPKLERYQGVLRV